MRNLKRVLSLSLASIMLLGMMVIGSSAAQDYSDVDYDNDNIEAIEVLDAINVMRGDLDANGELAGTFRPGSDVKRSEMARIMAFLMDLDYDYYIGVNPFSDMVGHWAEKFAAACAANGIIYGRGDGIYDPDKTVTAVEAASMLMRALGYFQNPAVDQPNGFEIDTIRQAGRINLFNKVNVKTNEPMTRNDVAQLVLNALQSGMVDLSTKNSVDVVVGDAQVTIGSSNYVYRVSRNDAVGNAINTDRADAGNSVDGMEGAILDLGEQLYQGELKLTKYTQDVYGRPARTWSFKGTEVGTYAKTELLQESYTTPVKGQEIYDLLGQSVIRDNELCVYLDGYLNGHNNDVSGNVKKTDLVRANNSNVRGTGRGVLTEVYLDNELERITIASINTYLAQANSDYNESSETISLTVYNNNGGITKLVDVEDVPAIAGLEKDDWILVNWADESRLPSDKVIQAIYDVDIMENVVVTGFAYNQKEDSTNYNDEDDRSNYVTDITVDGNTYKNNAQAWYKANTLNNYSTDKLVDKTYTLYMDQYGYFIGAELYSGKAQYVFITGYDRPESAIGTSTAKANGIFTDGAMGVIEVNVLDTNKNIGSADGYDQWDNDENHDEMWYSYTVRNGVYTLSPVEGWTRTYAAAADTVIDCSNARLVPSAAGSGAYAGTLAGAYYNTGNSYGEDASVYITVSMDDVDTNGSRNTNDKLGVTQIEGVYTGVQNVKLIYQEGDWAHAVYDPDNHYIVAAIVLGEAEGVVDNYAYIRDGVKNERTEVDDNGNYTHYWDVDVIMGGELTTKTIKSRYTNTAGNLVKNTVQELIMDADGYVTAIRPLPNAQTGGLVNGLYTGPEDDDGAGIPTNNDKVYTNYDYLNNTNTTKPDSADLADYSVYHLKFDTGAYGAPALGSTTITHDGTTYSFGGNLVTDLTLKGKTLHYDAGANDVGLTVKENAPGFIWHQVKGENKYEAPGSVSAAFAMINDADYIGTNNLSNGLQFKGEIVAVLDSRGVAEWVLFIDRTPPQTSTSTTTPTYPGKTIASNTPIATVQQYLYDDIDVIINGDWKPSDLLSHLTRTLIIPEGRTLTIDGDLQAYNNQNQSGKSIFIGGDSRTTSVLNVTGDLDLYGQDINCVFNVTGDMIYRTDGATRDIDSAVTVGGDLTLRGGGTVNVTSKGTLTVEDDITTAPTGGGARTEITVDGNAWFGSMTNVTISVNSTSSLHVTTVDADSVVNVGDGTKNGYAEIGTLNGDLVVENPSTSYVPVVNKVGATASIDIQEGKLKVEEEIATDDVAMAAGTSLAFGSKAKATGAALSKFVDGDGFGVANVGGKTINATGAIESGDPIEVPGGVSNVVGGKIASNATVDEIEQVLAKAVENGVDELSIETLKVPSGDTLEIPAGATLVVTGTASGSVEAKEEGAELVLDNVSVASNSTLTLEEDSNVVGEVTVPSGATLVVGAINEGGNLVLAAAELGSAEEEYTQLDVTVKSGGNVTISVDASDVEIAFSGTQTKPVVITPAASGVVDWDTERDALGAALTAILPDGGQVDLDRVVNAKVANDYYYQTAWGMISFAVPEDHVLIALYADSAKKDLIALTDRITPDSVSATGGVIAVTRNMGDAWDWKDDTHAKVAKTAKKNLIAGTYYYEVYELSSAGDETYESITEAKAAITAASDDLLFSGSFTLN